MTFTAAATELPPRAVTLTLRKSLNDASEELTEVILQVTVEPVAVLIGVATIKGGDVKPKEEKLTLATPLDAVIALAANTLPVAVLGNN